jgi:NTE family protein
MRFPWRPRLGLALGGGAARGVAHLGVLLELEQARIQPAALAGTSIGALIGGVWLTSEGAERAIERIDAFAGSVDYQKAGVEFLKNLGSSDTSWRTAFSRGLKKSLVLAYTMFRESFVGEEAFRHNTEFLIPDVMIEQLRLPMSVMATDLSSGRAVIFRRGSLRRAVMASSAIPGLFPPSERDGAVLVDGAVTERVPVRGLTAASVDVVVAVDLRGSDQPVEEPASGQAITRRARLISEWALRDTRLAAADLVVLPDVADIDPLDFSGSSRGVQRGREAMREQIPALRRRLRRAWWRRLLRAGASERLARMERRGLLGQPPWEMVA